MKIDLSNKIALITGSSKGIGFGIAKGLYATGAKVVLHGRDKNNISNVAASLGKDVEYVYGDLADASQAADVIAQLGDIGDVDIVINNVGIYEKKNFLDIPDEDWSRFWETNVMSGVRITKALLPKMFEKDWGRVIFISSESAFNIPEDMIHYGVTKSAMQGLARGIAETTRGTGVTVNSVLPGPTLSEGAKAFLNAAAEEQGISFEEAEKNFIRSKRPTSLIDRFATVEEVASMVTYVVSPFASATNGSALRVDGGVVKNIM